MLGATQSSVSFPRTGIIHIADPSRRRPSAGPGHGDRVLVVGPDPKNVENVICQVKGFKDPVSRLARNIKYDS
jgi:hypothetical protein